MEQVLLAHLLEKLLTSNNEILVLDNFLTGKKENIEFMVILN